MDRTFVTGDDKAAAVDSGATVRVPPGEVTQPTVQHASILADVDSVGR